MNEKLPPSTDDDHKRERDNGRSTLEKGRAGSVENGSPLWYIKQEGEGISDEDARYHLVFNLYCQSGLMIMKRKAVVASPDHEGLIRIEGIQHNSCLER